MSQNYVDIEIGREEHNWAKYHYEGRTPETKCYIVMSQNTL